MDNTNTISFVKSHNDFILKLVNDAINDYCDSPEMSLRWLHRNHPAFTNDVYMNKIFPKFFQSVFHQNVYKQ
jgi:hypothetical protein